MGFDTKVAEVALVVFGTLVIFLILGGIVIIALSFIGDLDCDRFLAVFGAIGAAVTLWATIIVPQWKRLLRRFRRNRHRQGG